MKKKIIVGIISVLVLFFLFLVWFKATYSMEIIETFEQGNIENNTKVLIVSQGSEYKGKVVSGLLADELFEAVYFKVIDVTTVEGINPDEWDAFVLLHTWEIFEPQEQAEKFIAENYDANKMFVVSTSASGGNAIEGVDGITGASELNKVDEDVTTIKLWLNEVLTLKNK
ncbi:hypothetical protein [Crocinitomix catalasitica]|uniref:hypothetical protein n=1 Tax=Crocinitomix catalasitica TaxID=184607 RepID=UPI000481CE3D|nr:hypothetical protein [Crocinitomix catalasitica]